MNQKKSTPLKRTSLQEQVADEIERRILERQYNPGDRLPSERELVEEFGVSRIVVRQALNTASVRGLVDVRHGSGSYVLLPDASNITEPLDRYLKLARSANRFDHLIEARFAVEVEIAGLAAKRASEKNVADLASNIALVSEMAESSEIETMHDEFVRLDLEFHLTLARASSNDLLLIFLQSINHLSTVFRKAAYLFDLSDAVSKATSLHTAIYERVAAHDDDGARDAMTADLKQAYDILQRAKRFPGGLPE